MEDFLRFSFIPSALLVVLVWGNVVGDIDFSSGCGYQVDSFDTGYSSFKWSCLIGRTFATITSDAQVIGTYNDPYAIYLFARG